MPIVFIALPFLLALWHAYRGHRMIREKQGKLWYGAASNFLLKDLYALNAGVGHWLISLASVFMGLMLYLSGPDMEPIFMVMALLGFVLAMVGGTQIQKQANQPDIRLALFEEILELYAERHRRHPTEKAMLIADLEKRSGYYLLWIRKYAKRYRRYGLL